MEKVALKPKIVTTKKLSSMHVGGEAFSVTISSDQELLEALSYAKDHSLRVHIHGEGTNTFFADTLEKLLIITVGYKGITTEEGDTNVRVKASAGENWDELVAMTVSKGWWGIENLSAIPGTVGAAPVQNIGAYGAELSMVCDAVRAYDRIEQRFVNLCKSACRFGYRDSLFKRSNGRYIITHIMLTLSKVPTPKLTYRPLDTLKEKTPSIEEIRSLVVATRTAKLPDYKKHPNCGSFFKNPTVDEVLFSEVRKKYPNIIYFREGYDYKIPAGWLIEIVAEMKGAMEGNVGTWKDQALVLVNHGKDTKASEVNAFANHIIDVVHKKTGILLEQEVQFVE